MSAAYSDDCWPGDDDTPGWCSCPMTHPVAVALLTPVWWLLSGEAQAAFTGAPCWAGWDDGW